jgi:hypothetical protein
LVFVLNGNDPEGESLACSIISGNENGAFGISGNNLTVQDNTKLNYDEKQSYNLVVSASDGNLSTSITQYVSLNKIKTGYLSFGR